MAKEAKAETDVDGHWKCVVYCKECKHMHWDEALNALRWLYRQWTL